MRVTYISWAPHCTRSDYTARELGGTSHMIYWGWLGSHPATVWLKYLGQALQTWTVLLRERADVVFVMSPPPVAIVPVYVFSLVWRRSFAVDAHTGVFVTRRWRHFQRLQFWLCRRAKTTIVTNEHLARLLESQGCRATVVPDVPIEFPSTATSSARMDAFSVVYVTSFDRDEPVAAMVEAARWLPDVRFFMTGDSELAERAVSGPLPSNLTLTGFLDSASYGALLRRADIVIALTTDDHTMQRGAYEGIYQGTPVVVSDTAVLRRAFDDGAVHVDNSPAAIVEAVLRIRGSAAAYREGAERLRARKMEQWQRTKSALLEAIC
jgi:glycosyltransferase involved in cell wall biosynthesis